MGAKASRIDQVAINERETNQANIDQRNINSISNESINYSDELSSRLVTKEFVWSSPAHSVYVTGAWDEWRTKIALARGDHGRFRAIFCLPLGKYQYKFIVDGNWKHNPGLPTERDEHGNLNNVIEVAPQVSEYDANEPLTGDAEARSPVDSYNFTILPKEDHTTEPPTLPRLLHSRPFNSISPSMSGTDFVKLNHVFSTRGDPTNSDNSNIRTLATEARYKSKVVTTILVTTVKKTMEVRLPIGFEGV